MIPQPPPPQVFNNGGPPPPPPPPASRAVTDVATRQYLTTHGWPTGLQNALVAGLVSTPARFFICDDSGSMMISDGHWVVGEGAQSKIIGCSRWSELTETLRFHVNTARVACAPTEFRMLNSAAPVSIGSSAQGDEIGIPIISSILDGTPSGGTPLCFHVNEVAKQITAIAPELRAQGKKAALIIYTDGEASDGDITLALRPLHQLPVWVVIRLCTDEDAIVGYWNNIDSQLELNLDIIDDPMGEGKEIQRLNYWLTYGTPLHRLREFGITAKEIDMIDEVKLSHEQMRNFCGFLFGVRAQDLPHPEANWQEFYDQINKLNDKEPKIWSSATKAATKWINMKNLTAAYGPKGKGKSGGGTDLGESCCVVA